MASAETFRIDLDVVLPHAHDGHDRCVEDLIDALSRFDGVEEVHVAETKGEPTVEVCMHLLAGAVSVRQLEQRVRATGAEIASRYGHIVQASAAVGHAGRADVLSERIRRLHGVVDAAVTVEGLVRVEFDTAETTESEVIAVLGTLGLRAAIDGPAHGLGPSPSSEDDHDHQHEHGHGASRLELGAAAVSLVVYLVARSLDWFTDAESIPTALYVGAAALTGSLVARDAWLSVRARVFDIDQLMLIAAVGAAFIGQWSDAALLLVLFSLGHALEGYAMNRARGAIEALSEFTPTTARRRDDPAVAVPIEEIEIDEVVVVRPNERVPVDGAIVAGSSTVDESAITGESIPVDKVAMADSSGPRWSLDALAPENRVFAGTLNGPGTLDVVVSRVAADSTLARVVQLVAEAETQISPTQRLTKRVVRVLVPAVLALVAILLILPPLLGEPFSESFARAMAVLVAASPCALAIATPSAVLASIARAARSGILVKGGGPLESLGSVSAIAFDKTGTLTEGRPVLTDVVAAEGVTETELLQVSLAIEATSDHPIAGAITAGASERLGAVAQLDAVGVSAVTGRGVVGQVNGQPTMIGNEAMFEEVGIPPEIGASRLELETEGRTTMTVRHGNRFLGVLGVMDTPRPEAASVVGALRRLGIDKVVMLSGDNQLVASAVGARVGIDDARGALLPADKVEAVNRLAEGGGVAMLGDGVNDAPALAAANVGVAMGAAGSDVALEAADIALMADHLGGLPVAVGLSRRAARTIRQNLFFSLGVVAMLIPLTILGVGISVAVIAHEGSTLVVVGNALRLLAYDAPEE